MDRAWYDEHVLMPDVYPAGTNVDIIFRIANARNFLKESHFLVGLEGLQWQAAVGILRKAGENPWNTGQIHLHHTTR